VFNKEALNSFKELKRTSIKGVLKYKTSN